MAKRPKVPFAKGRKFCIFCGAAADSEEHLWPRWAHHILPSAVGHRRWVLTGNRRTNQVLSSKGYDRQGSARTLRLKSVCGDCNGGWMGAYEERVRFQLERLIEGRRVFLTDQARGILAQYFTYKMMVFDWLDDDPVTPPEWAKEFYRSRTIPEGTKIWAFNCIEGSWRGDFQTAAFGLSSPADWHPNLPKNTKSFSIGFGDLFVFAIFSVEIDLDLDFGPDATVFRLWPPHDGLMIWPLSQPILTQDAAYISGTIMRLGDSADIDADGSS